MIYLTNIAGNVKMGFDFLNNLSADFDITGSKFENWIPFVLNLSASGRTIAITEDMQASMTIYEVEKIYNGLKQLLDSSVDKLNKRFTHYSSESFFEVSFEHLHVDECFNVELWFVDAEYLEGEIAGYDAGFRFVVDKLEMKNFIQEFYISFKRVCPQWSL